MILCKFYTVANMLRITRSHFGTSHFGNSTAFTLQVALAALVPWPPPRLPRHPVHASGLRGSSGRAVLSVRRGHEILYVHDQALATEYLFGPAANPTAATNQDGSAQTIFNAALGIRNMLQSMLHVPCRHLRDAALQLRRCHAP